MVRPLVIALCLVALAACNRPFKHRDHPSATEDRWQVDRAECRALARR